MEALEAVRAAAQIVRAGIAWWRHDTRFPSPVPENAKFRTAAEAASLVADGDVVAVSGLGGQQRASIVYWALRERFERSGHPAGLTLVNVGSHGGRGIAPGTLEELARPGLCTRFVSSHFEALPAFLALAEAGECEIQCLPLGVITRVFAAQARGEDAWVSEVGVGTFLDPRTGSGSRLTAGPSEPLIVAEGERLRFRLPPIDVAICNLPAADRHGNVYARGCASLGESRELARAARRNRGRVIVNVGVVVEEPAGEVFLRADEVDAIVYHPDTEQIVTVFHRAPWSVFTTESDTSIEDGLARLRMLNRVAGRGRSEADRFLARLAARALFDRVGEGARVSIGTGLPEEVAARAAAGGALGALTFVVESGVIGGLPAPGVFFGASLCPERIGSSAELFALCDERLDATCLGALEVDGAGNVNASRRGDGVRGFVGPGGFPDFAAAADTIVFVCGWMRGGEIRVADGRVTLGRHGRPKFVERVREVTFDAARARRRGKTVLYATHVGLLRLGERGLEMVSAAPGIDVRRDVSDFATAAIALPAGRIPRVPRAVVTGEGFRLRRPSRD